ncbi:4-coumarate--CoA ligase 1 [Hibiscus syriacus]|uniref:4-coumarate--CoA ligase n=1 Tax=Hibiscus syriacus TaxID=106335 RepID=A0A6A3AAJ7_HIBSY|nr:4-coumarate--CoA ligase 1 [Hibiscus syriacus]
MVPQAELQQEEIMYRSKLPDIYIPRHLPLHWYCFENLSSVVSGAYLINGTNGKVYTYAEVELTARKVTSGLGIQQCHVIMLLLPNTLEFVLLFLGTIATTANPFFTPTEISKQAKASNARLIITQAIYVDKVKEFAQDNDVKVICIDSTPRGLFTFLRVDSSRRERSPPS